MKKATIFIALFLLLMPLRTFAHGTAEQHQQEGIGGLLTYFVIGSAILFLLFFIIYFVMKGKINRLNARKREERDRKRHLSQWLAKVKWTGGVFLAALVVSGSFSLFSNAANNASRVTFTHVHGLGFSNDGQKILVPSHDGLRVFNGGKWHVPEGQKNDYMGFSMVDDGFYSSGHPEKGSNLKNPLGVVKSTDGGKNLQTLALLGESDFHNMDVGYFSHAIYVFNPGANSEMDKPGIYYSTDNAKTWKRSALNGVVSQLSSLAVHQKKENVIALGTKNGIYLSEDFGNNVNKALSQLPVTAVTFGNEGNLWVGSLQGEASLLRYNLKTGKYQTIDVPVEKDDVITYIAQSPQNPQKVAITTSNKDIYLTQDGGSNWKQIADDGKGIPLKQNE